MRVFFRRLWVSTGIDNRIRPICHTDRGETLGVGGDEDPQNGRAGHLWRTARHRVVARLAHAVLLVTLILSSVPSAVAQEYPLVEGLCAKSPVSVFVPSMELFWTELAKTRETLRVMNLDPALFDWVSAQSKKWVGLDVLDAASLKKHGVALDHPWALVAHAAGPVLIVGTTNPKQFTTTIAKSLSQILGQNVKSKTKSTAYGSVSVLPLDSGVTVAVGTVKGVERTTLVGSVDAIEGILRDVSQDSLNMVGRDPAARLLMNIRFDEFAAMVSEPELAEALDECNLGVYADGPRFNIRGNCSFKPTVANFTDLFVPVFQDSGRQTRFLEELPGDPASIVRLLVPTSAIKQLLVNTGVWTPEVRQEAADSLGFDLETDVLDVFLGDVTWIVPTGLADLRIEMTVTDSGKAQKLLAHVLDIDESPDGPRLQTASKQIQGVTVFETKVVLAGDDDWISPRFYWSFRDGRLVLGLTETSVLPPMGPTIGQFATLYPDIAGHLKAPSTFFMYQRAEDGAASLLGPMKLIRNQFGDETRQIMAFVDILALSMDQSLYGWAELLIRPGGVELNGSGESVDVDPAGNKSTASGAYATALKDIYSGEIYSGKQKLLDITKRFPGTSQSVRAERALFASSSLYAYYQAMSGAITLPWLVAMFSSGAFTSPAPQEAGIVDVGDPCITWAHNVCYYRGTKSKECAAGRKLLKSPPKMRKKPELEKCALELYEMRGY